VPQHGLWVTKDELKKRGILIKKAKFKRKNSVTPKFNLKKFSLTVEKEFKVDRFKIISKRGRDPKSIYKNI